MYAVYLNLFNTALTANAVRNRIKVPMRTLINTDGFILQCKK